MTFSRRPTSVPPDIRPEWRLPLLLLLVHQCRAKQASREQLHVLNSAVLNAGSRVALTAALSGRLAPQVPMVQYEPALDRAIDRCIGLGLLRMNTTARIQLTESGQAVVDALESNTELFTREREFLSVLPNAISQATIRRALQQRRAR